MEKPGRSHWAMPWQTIQLSRRRVCKNPSDHFNYPWQYLGDLTVHLDWISNQGTNKRTFLERHR